MFLDDSRISEIILFFFLQSINLKSDIINDHNISNDGRFSTDKNSIDINPNMTDSPDSRFVTDE